MNILVVEDETRLSETLAQLLRDEGHRAEVAANGLEGLALARAGRYDVMILDVMLPEMDGFEVARTLREEKNAIPILMLTAKGETADKVCGLDCGADDYMTKPFAPEELLARVRALGRRQGEPAPEELVFADLRLELGTRSLCSGDRSVGLSPKEFDLLRLLMASPGAVVTKETLIAGVWGPESGVEDNNLEAYISFLRKKFFYLGSGVGISARRKVGYLLEEAQESGGSVR